MNDSLRQIQNYWLVLWQGKANQAAQTEAHPTLSLSDTDTKEQIRAKAQAHVKASIAWQNRHYQDWLDNVKRRHDAEPARAAGGLKRILQSIWLSIQVPRHRMKWMFAGGVAGIVLLTGVYCVVTLSPLVTNAILQEWLKPNSVTGTLISVLVASPVAFLIWAYRDQNTTWSIENQRKDINLKDFQKLCEWATGQHLIEGKTVESKKTGVDKDNKPIAETTVSSETGKRYEDSHSLSKVRAAEALQVAAIYQLQAFLEGEFGKQFMRPAFALLLAVYRGLTEAQVAAGHSTLLSNTKFTLKDDVQLTAQFQSHRKLLLAVIDHPIGVALTGVLLGDRGVRIRQHALELRAGILHGLSTQLQGIQSLYLANLDMNNLESNASVLADVGFQGSNLSSAKLGGNLILKSDFTFADVSWANFRGTTISASIRPTSFVCAQMYFVNFTNTDMYGVRFDGASLRHAQFNDSELRNCLFTYSDCLRCSFARTDLRQSNFKGSILSAALFLSADLRLVKISEETVLTGCQINAETKFGELPSDIDFWDAKDSDYINADTIRAEWIARGAIEVDE